MTKDSDQPTEIEVPLENNTELKLNTIEIDSKEYPLEFSVDGIIRNIDPDIMNALNESELKPTAIRFKRVDNDE